MATGAVAAAPAANAPDFRNLRREKDCALLLILGLLLQPALAVRFFVHSAGIPRSPPRKECPFARVFLPRAHQIGLRVVTHLGSPPPTGACSAIFCSLGWYTTVSTAEGMPLCPRISAACASDRIARCYSSWVSSSNRRLQCDFLFTRLVYHGLHRGRNAPLPAYFCRVRI